MALPAMTPEKRQAALAAAARARAERAAAIQAVRDGTVAVPAVLRDGESPLQKVRVRQLLLAVPRTGPATADRILADLGIDGKRRVRGLGARQREALTARFS